MLQRSSARYVVVLYLADLLIGLLALWAARWVRVALPYGKLLDDPGAALHWPMLVLVAIIWSVIFAGLRAYDPQRLTQTADEIQTVIAAVGLATLVFAGALYFTYRGLSRLLYGYFFLLDVAGTIGARLVLRYALRERHRARTRRVLIIGAGAVGQRLARSLRPYRWMGVEVVGYLDDQIEPGRMIEDCPVLGAVDRAAEIVVSQGVREVVLALPMDAHRRMINLVAQLQELPVNIKAAPDYSELVLFRATLEQLGGVALVGLKEPVIGPIDRWLKRLFDVLVAAAGLAALALVFAVIAILVKLGSPGPVFYRSRRVGEGGREFDMIKFRTMKLGADQRERELISETADGKVVFDKRADDPRITPIGRFLRRYSLDELPQLYNVLSGEMSLVGPRPELPSLVERYEPWQRKRFGVPQGMTGWWQISGRGSKAKYLHVEDDLFYIQNYSLLLDLRILWRTLGAVLRGEGAF